MVVASHHGDMKLEKIKKFENNSSRANGVQSFILDIEWEEYIKELEVLESITKEEVRGCQQILSRQLCNGS